MNSAIERLISLRVRDAMNRPVVQVPQQDSLLQAARTFCEKSISGAPVIDAQQRCVGILSANDFVKCFAGRHGIAAEAGSRNAGDSSAGHHPVSQHMTPEVRSIAADETLLAAARLMCQEHIHRLPVLDAQSRVVGMLTSLDIVAALVQAVEE